MDTMVRTDNAVMADATSGVSWASIAAGAVAAAALSLALLAFGSGLGLSSVSPWGNSGVSASTFGNVAGVYLVVVAVMSSAVGGYLAARLRTRWSGLHTNEVFFRDTAHGFIAWAFATLISASVLSAAITHVVGGVASAAGPVAAQGAQSATPSQLYVDRLFRAPAPASATTGSPATAGNNQAARAEILRLWSSSFRDNRDVSAADRTYIAQVVAARTGISQSDAEKRVNDTVVEAKAAVDQARRSAAKLAFWLTAALFFGAFAASLAAVEGGQLRDGTWQDRRLVPRAL